MSLRGILFVSKSLLIFLLIYAIYTVASHRNTDSVPTPSLATPGIEAVSSEPKPTQKLSMNDFAKIIGNDPFGSPSDQPSVTEVKPPPPPAQVDDSFAMQSDLTLIGTLTGSRSVARAIIKNNETNKLNFYKIGQFICDARIESIEDNAVVLIHNGQNINLPITSWAPVGHIQSSQLASQTAGTVKTRAVTAKNIARKAPKSRNRKNIESAQEILAKTTIKPYIVNGQNEGLEISGLENMNFAKKIGLKNGDAITAINGHRLTSKQRAYQIFKKARHQKTLSLDLIRDNKFKNISFAVR